MGLGGCPGISERNLQVKLGHATEAPPPSDGSSPGRASLPRPLSAPGKAVGDFIAVRKGRCKLGRTHQGASGRITHSNERMDIVIICDIRFCNKRFKEP